MKIYTIERGEILKGATVNNLILREANINTPAILVGGQGLGKQLGALPVRLTTSQEAKWLGEGQVRIRFAKEGMTRTGRLKLLSMEHGAIDNDDRMICVFRTPIGTGLYGGNSHTGNQIDEVRYDCLDDIKHSYPIFAPFPGRIICKGVITQGYVGHKGSGDQIIAVMPPNCIFRTGYSGRLHGVPSSHFYCWDGKELTRLATEKLFASNIL
jgi:hypothetical protein